MANTVYDSDADQEHAPVSGSQLDDLEQNFAAPSATESGSQKLDETKALEDKFAAPSAKTSGSAKLGSKDDSNNEENPIKFSGGAKAKAKTKAKGLLKGAKKKWILTGAAGSGVVVIGVIILLLIIASSLKIQNLSQNIISYEFAQVTRQFAKSASRSTEEALSLEATDEATSNALTSRFQSLRDNTLGRLENLNPNKAINNALETVGEDNGFKLNLTTTITGKQVLKSAEINGQTYEVKQLTNAQKWTPFLKNYLQGKNVAAVADQITPQLETALNAQDINQLIRFSAVAKVRKDINVSLVGWILDKFKDKTADEAKLEEARENYATTNKAANAPDNASTEQIKDADSAAKQAEQDVVADDKKLASALANNGVSSDVTGVIKSAVSSSLTTDVLDVINPFYAIVTPLCIIYDGSVQHSGSTIDNQANQQQAQFYSLAAKADQQKYGTPNSDSATATALATAIGATNDEYGDINKANIQLQASGQAIDTSSNLSAEAGAGGSYDFSLINALGLDPNSVASKAANAVVGTQCSLLTNTYAAAGLGAVNIIAGILSGGGTEAGEETAGQSARLLITNYVKGLLAKTITKDGVKTVEQGVASRAKQFIFKQGAIIGSTVGATELANIIVASRAGQMNSGLAQQTDKANIDQSGAIIAAGEIQRKVFDGRALTQDEITQSQAADQRYITAQNQSKSLYTRYFATSNANSLLSRMAMSVGANFKPGFINTLIHFASYLMQPARYFGSILSAFSHKTQAASPDNHYGNVIFGWSENEESLIDSTPSYRSQLLNQEVLDQSGQEDAINAKYSKCFSETLGTLLSSGDIARDSDGNVLANQGDCSPNNLGPTNSQYGDLVFRWRLANRQTSTVSQLTEQSGADTTATAQTGT